MRTDIRHPEYFFFAALLLAAVLFLRGGDAPAESQNALLAGAGAGAASVTPFDSLALHARSVFVYDWRTKEVLFERNADETFPLASVTKIMTAATALSLVPETLLIVVDARAVEEEGDSGLRVGERWLLRELVKKMLLESSNDAAYAIAASVGSAALDVPDAEVGRMFFIARMNEFGKRLGFKHTFFKNESGLDLSANEPGAVSTAREAALLLGNALSAFPAVFNETRWNELVLRAADGAVTRAENTNHTTQRLPLLLASKTGYTDLAGGNLVVAFDAGFSHPIIVSVLGSSREGRFADAEKLVWATLEFLQRN